MPVDQARLPSPWTTHGLRFPTRMTLQVLRTTRNCVTVWNAKHGARRRAAHRLQGGSSMTHNIPMGGTSGAEVVAEGGVSRRSILQLAAFLGAGTLLGPT